MTLNNKLAFEIWVGIVVLVIVIGGAAGVTLMLDNDATSSLTRTQVNNPASQATATPLENPRGEPTAQLPTFNVFASQDEISNAATSVGALFAP